MNKHEGQLVAGPLCFWVQTQRRGGWLFITDTAPIAKWAIGKRYHVLVNWLSKKYDGVVEGRPLPPAPSKQGRLF